ncbi:CpsD/CapB family tyrosine-protein kinase [Paenibacillus agricola]|uniref:non-specific protein-tyrosine kinase n=1 Tax=Paenibacillus agricola TaxID=2716264 RepID=A0ABX0IZT9_9BACL|nr:CpsD/CapB family tyrosine-protein kinase [Paenibacillus agricola]NHN29402.1 CpsD/CapB family tyrosine-protein kinase [Paenibacillus agricola]
MHPSSRQYPLLIQSLPQSSVAEAFKTLRTNIKFSTDGAEPKVVLVTSAEKGEGKSTTTASLVTAYALDNKRVLVIDADLRKPTLHHFFGKSNRLGLSNLLAQQCSLEEALLDTGIPNLTMIASGTIALLPTEILGSDRMKDLLQKLAESFDMVIIDSPPVLMFSDAQILAAQCDGVVMVINCGRVKAGIVKKAKEQLEFVGAKVLGATLNNVKKYDEDFHYYYGVK